MHSFLISPMFRSQPRNVALLYFNVLLITFLSLSVTLVRGNAFDQCDLAPRVPSPSYRTSYSSDLQSYSFANLTNPDATVPPVPSVSPAIVLPSGSMLPLTHLPSPLTNSLFIYYFLKRNSSFTDIRAFIFDLSTNFTSYPDFLIQTYNSSLFNQISNFNVFLSEGQSFGVGISYATYTLNATNSMTYMNYCEIPLLAGYQTGSVNCRLPNLFNRDIIYYPLFVRGPNQFLYSFGSLDEITFNNPKHFLILNRHLYFV
jgi:hypothetical protein